MKIIIIKKYNLNDLTSHNMNVYASPPTPASVVWLFMLRRRNLRRSNSAGLIHVAVAPVSHNASILTGVLLNVSLSIANMGIMFTGATSLLTDLLYEMLNA